MADRNMTEKGFLHKASGKAAVSAGAFLAQHREWLETGTLASLTAPILARLDAGEIMPTPALGEIRQAVISHMIAREIVKGQRAVEHTAKEPSKPYLAKVYDAAGNVCTRVGEDGEAKDLVQGFDLSQRAHDWCNRRLDEQEPGAYALITWQGTTMRIERDDAIYRLHGAHRAGPAMKRKPTSAALGWKMKAQGDHFHFSRG